MQVHQCVCIYTYMYIHNMATVAFGTHMHLGCVDSAYAYSICNIHVYIDILYACSKIVIYYHIWNYFLTKLKHYMFFHAPDQTIENKSITCSKNGTTHNISTLSMLCVAISHCVIYLNLKSMFLPFMFFCSCSCYVTQLLRLRHAVVLLATCLLYKFCKVLLICRRIL